MDASGQHPTDSSRLALRMSGVPKHAQIRTYFSEQLASGKLRPGDPLPPEVKLASMLGVARSTVRQAMARLEQEGLIRRIRGKGTFIQKKSPKRDLSKQDLFALVLPETEGGFYPALQRSFEEAAAESHSQIVVCCSDNSVDKQGNLILQLLDKSVGGVAIVPVSTAPTPTYQVRQLQHHGIPVVFCHRSVEGAVAPLLAIPYNEVGRRAGEAIIEQGHRRAAFFASHMTPITKQYEEGLRTAMEAAGGEVPSWCVHYSNTAPLDFAAMEPNFAQALERMLATEDRPTAIFASFDSLAEMIYLLLERMNLRVPGDISLVGFGGTTRRTPLIRLLTSVTIDEIREGREAAEWIDQMRRGEVPIHTEALREMTVGLSDGRTLGPPPGRRDSVSS